MNREEAKAYGEEWIKGLDSLCDNDKRNLDDEDEELYEFLKTTVSALRQESCGDAISRQAVDKLIDELARAISDERCFMSRGRSTATIMQDILDLPSVSTEKTGRWEEVQFRTIPYNRISKAKKCSACGKRKDKYVTWNYCPNCGAKMVDPRESEVQDAYSN